MIGLRCGVRIATKVLPQQLERVQNVILPRELMGEDEVMWGIQGDATTHLQLWQSIGTGTGDLTTGGAAHEEELVRGDAEFFGMIACPLHGMNYVIALGRPRVLRCEAVGHADDDDPMAGQLTVPALELADIAILPATGVQEDDTREWSIRSSGLVNHST